MPGWLRWILVSLATAAVGAGALWIYGEARYGSLTAGLLALQGYALAPSPSVQVISDLRGSTDVPFTLQNLTSAPVTIVGAKSSCGCTALQGLPVTIPARETAELHVLLSPSPRDVGKSMGGTVQLYLDVASPPIVLEVEAILVSQAETLASGSNVTSEVRNELE